VILRSLSLRTLLLLAIGLVVVLALGLTVTVGALLTRREVDRASQADVSHQANLLAIREASDVNPFVRLQKLRPSLRRQGDEVHVATLKKPSRYVDEETLARLRAEQKVDGTRTIDGTIFYYAARPVLGKALVLVRPKSVASDSWAYVNRLLLAGLVGFLLAVLAAFGLARAIARPVRRVVDATRSLAAEQSPEHVPEEGASELASLAASFNHMAAQLAKARAAERSFLLSVSHELKTPLTAIRGYAEGLSEHAVPVEEAAETIQREASRLERLVRDLLDLARMNKSEFSVHREPVDLGVAAREAVRRYESQALSFGVELGAVVREPAGALGDGDRLSQIVSNLVENALRSTPAGGFVRIVAEPCAIRVEDSGPGLQREELPHAFDRFYLYSRYGRERSVGTGLGLAIVKELAEGMGGTVEVESDPGRLTRFTVHLSPAGAREAAEPADDILVRT